MQFRSWLLVLFGAALVAALPGARPAAAAAGQFVAVVIDFGPGGPPPIVKCVEARGQSEYQAVADALGGPDALRFAPSGLLCGIEGIPATGCGVRTAGTYAYWAVFNGGASGWTFANDNPGVQVASPSTPIGLRYEPTGSGSASDPAPSVSADPAVDCPVSSPTATPTTAAVPAPGGSGTAVPLAATPTTAAPAATTSTAPGSTTTRGAHSVSISAHALAERSTGSSPVPTMLAIGAFGLVGIAAGFAIRRRRRAA
jgi:MYXO-CTERM domain-containing protein